MQNDIAMAIVPRPLLRVRQDLVGGLDLGKLPCGSFDLIEIAIWVLARETSSLSAVHHWPLRGLLSRYDEKIKENFNRNITIPLTHVTCKTTYKFECFSTVCFLNSVQSAHVVAEIPSNLTHPPKHSVQCPAIHSSKSVHCDHRRLVQPHRRSDFDSHP